MFNNLLAKYAKCRSIVLYIPVGVKVNDGTGGTDKDSEGE